MRRDLVRSSLRPLAAAASAATLAALAMLGTPALAAPSYDELKAQGAQAVLANADAITNRGDTQVWTFKMTVKPKGGPDKSLVFRVWQKARRDRLVRFLDPGEVKGMSILQSGKKVMYVYSPQTDNVRRVAAHARRQKLLGSNLSYDDMATVDMADGYDAAFDEDAGAQQWLVLTPKPDAESAWSKLRVRVDKKTQMIDRIEYFDDGKLVRRQERDRWEQLDGFPAYRRVQMIDADGELTTVLEMEDRKVNEDLPDSMFKKKSLVRGG